MRKPIGPNPSSRSASPATSRRRERPDLSYLIVTPKGDILLDMGVQENAAIRPSPDAEPAY
jgi:hypothetical protein